MAAALFLCAGNAEARKIYVSPIGADSLTGGATNSGLVSGTPLRTFDYALSRTNYGDTIICAASAGVHSSGRYADGIIPQAYDRVFGVTIIGDSINPNRVVVPSVNISGTTANFHGFDFSNMVLNGIRVNGNVQLGESYGCNTQEFGTNAKCGLAENTMLRNCVVRNNFTATNVDFKLFKVRVGLAHANGAADSGSSRFSVSSNPEPVFSTLDSCRIWAQPATASTYTDKAIEFWADGDTRDLFHTITASKCSLRVYAPTNWNPEKPTGFRSLRDCRFTDNTWELIDSTGTSELDQGWLFRDNLEGNVWCRDSFFVRTVRAGTGAAGMKLTSPGSFSATPSQPWQVGERNTWRFCWFESNIPVVQPTGGTMGFDWQMQPGDSLYGCTSVCSTGVAGNSFNINNAKGVVTVKNNTFYNFGSGPALSINHDSQVCSAAEGGSATDCCWDGTLVFENNIVYSRSTATGASDYALSAVWPDFPAQPRFLSDYNLFYQGGSTSGYRAMKGGYCGRTGTLFNVARMDSAFGNDKHSLFGSPLFTDSSFANFNATLSSASSYADCAGRSGSTIGAVDVDCLRPESVSDLSVTNIGPTTVAIAWTATGDDSLSGTPSLYDVRWAASLLAEAGWAAATVVTGEPTPSMVGTRETLVVTGLTASTTYYFGLKVRDEFGNYSELSNIASFTTPSSGPEVASP